MMGDEDLIRQYEQAIQDITSSDRVPAQTHVYILGCGGHIKVGIANNVPSRILELQIGNPAPILELWKSSAMTRVEASRLERRVHLALADARIRGEWFQCSIERAMKVISGLPGAH